MRVIITGGCGFLGRKLAARLLADRADLEQLQLVDLAVPEDGWSLDDERVSISTGDIAERNFIDSLVDADTDVIVHLASVVSAGAEQNFELGYSVNLLGTLALLERCRVVNAETGRRIQVVFTSSLATYGSGAGGAVDDSTPLRPETSYGVHKASCELLLNDYHRKGFIDGRGLRLPTVSVRPGKPNLAASGFASGIIREPLNGLDMTCPVTPETVMAVISPRRVIDAFRIIMDADSDAIGVDRTVLLPGLAMSMADAVNAVQQEGAARSPGRNLGTVSFEVDPTIQQIVDSWPPSITSRRAADLGLVGDPSVAAIVRQHISDELER